MNIREIDNEIEYDIFLHFSRTLACFAVDKEKIMNHRKHRNAQKGKKPLNYYKSNLFSFQCHSVPSVVVEKREDYEPQ